MAIIEALTCRLCDTGCSFELVLPGQKAHQLQLEVRRQTMTKGYGNVQSKMTIFSPLCVTIALLDPTSNEAIYKVRNGFWMDRVVFYSHLTDCRLDTSSYDSRV